MKVCWQWKNNSTLAVWHLDRSKCYFEAILELNRAAGIEVDAGADSEQDIDGLLSQFVFSEQFFDLDQSLGYQHFPVGHCFSCTNFRIELFAFFFCFLLSLLHHLRLELFGPELAELPLDGLRVCVDNAEHLCSLHTGHAENLSCDDQLTLAL